MNFAIRRLVALGVPAAAAVGWYAVSQYEMKARKLQRHWTAHPALVAAGAVAGGVVVGYLADSTLARWVLEAPDAPGMMPSTASTASIEGLGYGTHLRVG